MLIGQTLNFSKCVWVVIRIGVGGLVDSLTLRGGGKSVELCCCGGGQLVELKKIYFYFCSHVLTCGEPPFSCHTTLRRLLWFTSRPDLSSWVSDMPWWVGTFNDLLGWVRCHVVSGGWLIGSWLTPKFWVDWNLIVIQSSTVPCSQGTVGCLLS